MNMPFYTKKSAPGFNLKFKFKLEIGNIGMCIKGILSQVLSGEIKGKAALAKVNQQAFEEYNDSALLPCPFCSRSILKSLPNENWGMDGYEKASFDRSSFNSATGWFHRFLFRRHRVPYKKKTAGFHIID